MRETKTDARGSLVGLLETEYRKMSAGKHT